MANHERQEFGEDPTTKYRWVINLHQMNKLVEALVGYDCLLRIRKDTDNVALPPEYVVWFVEPLEDYSLNILVEQTPKRGKFSLTASRGVLPIIRDVFGYKFPPGEEIF